MNPFSYIGEKLWPKTIIEKDPTSKIIRSEFARERPQDVTFARLIDYYDRTPQLQITVGNYTELITGTELQVNTKSEEAQNVIDEWIRNSNFMHKYKGLVTTMLICGNAILEKLDERKTEDVVEVDMSTIMGKKRDEFGNLEYYEHRTHGGGVTKLGEGKLGKFIEFNLTDFSRQAWGRSIFYSLAIPRRMGNRVTAPLIEVMWQIEDAMGAIYTNNAYPITTITYPGASDTYLRKEAERWEKYKPGDKRVQKIKPEIEFFEVQGAQSRFDTIVEHIEKAFELGTQFPHDIMTGDFTSRASSETTGNLVEKRVRGFQRYLHNKLKQELFDPILIQNGFDPAAEELEVTSQTQEIIELQPDQVLARGEKKFWSKKEVREWDRANLGVELPDDKEILQQDQMQQQIADLQNQIQNEQPQQEKKIRKCQACKEGQHTFCVKRGCQCQ